MIEQNKTQKQLKDTVFLPKTDFPMQGSLAQNEPVIADEWRDSDIFGKLRKLSKNREKFIVHFGPPYANGAIHSGHALIGILKDAVAKSYQMLGYDTPLVIGWDCHGLPIEWKIEEEYLKQGKKREDISVVEFMSRCREFAAKWMEIQKEGFRKLGIIADFKEPYNTMDKGSEATICEKFFDILEKGLVYRGKKPVMWSVVEKTALAEAELEYHDKVSDAIFVKFPIIKTSNEKLKNCFVVIWTTTPWTIPGNRAVAYSAEFEYAILKVGDEKYVVAKELVASFVKEAAIEAYEVFDTIIGNDFEGAICAHPLSNLGFSYEVPMLPASHVTIDAGTGLVHTAPAHGLEDFILGKKFGLPVEDILNDDGTLIDTLPHFAGKHLFKVNPEVIEELGKSGNLIHSYKITHSYPHSWRSKAPLVYRTTTQWFIEIDKIRDQLLDEVDKTKWFPEPYINRIRSMIEKRPDWCISRQRIWGVPIALFIDKETDKVLEDKEVFDRIIESFRCDGIESWWIKPASYFLGNKYDPEKYTQIFDTLEVWFDSACSHHYVLEKRDYMKWPADLYFEGSDQHRGWFQSSLVESVCVTGKAPYKQVATNGFVLDKDGRKMSKSLGNVISPDDVTSKLGADVLRLWCLNSDYSEDMRIGDEILKRQQDVYRRFRNTLRYLLGVLSDYDPKRRVSYYDLPELEKFVLNKLYKLDKLLRESLRKFNFRAFYSELHTFCSNELSAFYFDIRKDSVYCDNKASKKRLACLTVMNEIFVCLTHWLAPALSFTAEEAWLSYPFNISKTSVHLELFPIIAEEWKNEEIERKWEFMQTIKKTVTESIEIERNAKTIGSSLEAEIYMYSSDLEVVKLLETLDFSEIAIVSKSTIISAQVPPNANLNENINVGVIVKKATGAKCDRCWKIMTEVEPCETSYGKVKLCKRCLEIIQPPSAN
ncbi:MAG: isoleucine--tRNA ligase [Holosporales bacterium]|jgi:isoleucyl-tRNA synthetase|nr:isoleucine--tRNA ligase [Holosporales bacterium]